MIKDIELLQNHNLLRLKKILNYELSSSLLFLLSFQIFIFIFFATAAAIIFSPFMLKALFDEKRYGWIIAFFVIVIFPVLLFSILSFFYDVTLLLFFIPFGLFYFYCFLLRFEVNSWVREAGERNQYLIEKQRRELEHKILMDQFEKES